MWSKDNDLLIYVEYKKGLLFLHLKGKVKRTNKKTLDKIIIFFKKNIGIKYFVFNFELVDQVEKHSFDILKKYHKVLFVFYNLSFCEKLLEKQKNVLNLETEKKIFELLKV